MKLFRDEQRAEQVEKRNQSRAGREKFQLKEETGGARLRNAGPRYISGVKSHCVICAWRKTGASRSATVGEDN